MLALSHRLLSSSLEKNQNRRLKMRAFWIFYVFVRYLPFQKAPLLFLQSSFHRIQFFGCSAKSLNSIYAEYITIAQCICRLKSADSVLQRIKLAQSNHIVQYPAPKPAFLNTGLFIKRATSSERKISASVSTSSRLKFLHKK